MRIDATGYPIVHLHYGASADDFAEIDTLLAKFSQLLQRGAPFAFIADGNPDDNTQSEQQRLAYRKQLSLWMKANREAIRRLVKGQVYLAADAQQQGVMQAFAQTFVKFWGFPLFVTQSEEEAKDNAKALLDTAGSGA